LEDASRELNIPLRKLPDNEAVSVVREAQARYVIGNPRVWSLALKPPYARHDGSTTSIQDVLPRHTGPVFLIPEADSLPLVYEIDASHLDAILKGCPYFEYNVIDPTLRWLLAESEHDVIYVSRHPGDET
jgi:hypothetical protein